MVASILYAYEIIYLFRLLNPLRIAFENQQNQKYLKSSVLAGIKCVLPGFLFSGLPLSLM